MSIESSELVSLREGQYAAASLGVEPERPETPSVDDNEPNGLCRCCGKWRYIPDGINYCLKCDEEEP